jgi:lysophospholipase L1-like esterase
VAGPPAVPTAPAGATINPAEYATISASVTSFNTAIASLATARGYALVNANAALAALPTCTPGQATPCLPFVPSFTTPSTLFGPAFSLDGIHPNKAGHRVIAQLFAAAINTTFGTTLVVP